jgi:hypothetical protein
MVKFEIRFAHADGDFRERGFASSYQ